MAALWDEWGRLTRFLESTRLAFARERDLWNSLGLVNAQSAKLSAPAGQGQYKVGLKNHLATIGDEEILMASVLIHTFALAESAAADHLQFDARWSNGIEDWGERLLSHVGHDWTGVHGGLAGAVEVAVVRNAFAHGTKRIDAAAATRLAKAGAPARPAGSTVTLSYSDLKEYRKRLQSLLRQGDLG